jgi:hypothetical protein
MYSWVKSLRVQGEGDQCEDQWQKRAQLKMRGRTETGGSGRETQWRPRGDATPAPTLPRLAY